MSIKVLFWFPRILAILAILFMLMFGFDAFMGNEPFGKKILSFLMNSIPAFVMILVLILAWKKEMIGGMIFILVFIGLGFFFKSFSGNTASLGIITPFLLTGIMFIVHHFLAGKKAN